MHPRTKTRILHRLFPFAFDHHVIWIKPLVSCQNHRLCLTLLIGAGNITQFISRPLVPFDASEASKLSKGLIGCLTHSALMRSLDLSATVLVWSNKALPNCTDTAHLCFSVQALTCQSVSHLLYRLSLEGRGGCWSRSQLSLGERRGTPWTGRQSVAGPTYRDRQPFTPTGNLESPVNLTCMSLDCGRKPGYLERAHAGTRRTCKLHTGGLNSEPSYCEAGHCATVPPALTCVTLNLAVWFLWIYMKMKCQSTWDR